MDSLTDIKHGRDDEKELIQYWGARLALTPKKVGEREMPKMLFEEFLSGLPIADDPQLLVPLFERQRYEHQSREQQISSDLYSRSEEAKKIAEEIIQRLGLHAYYSLGKETEKDIEKLWSGNVPDWASAIQLGDFLGRKRINSNFPWFRYKKSRSQNQNADTLASFVSQLLDDAWDGKRCQGRSALINAACKIEYHDKNFNPYLPRDAKKYLASNPVRAVVRKLRTLGVKTDSMLAESMVGAVIAHEGRRELAASANDNLQLKSLECWTRFKIESLFPFQGREATDGCFVLIGARAMTLITMVKNEKANPTDRNQNTAETFPATVWYSVIKRIVNDTIDFASSQNAEQMSRLTTAVSLLCPDVILDKKYREKIMFFPELTEALAPIRNFLIRRFFAEEIGEATFENYLAKQHALDARTNFDLCVNNFYRLVDTIERERPVSLTQRQVFQDIKNFVDELRQRPFFAQPDLFSWR